MAWTTNPDFVYINNNMENIIQVKNLKKQFGDFVAVDDISFEVKTGEIFAGAFWISRDECELSGSNLRHSGGIGEITTHLVSFLYLMTSPFWRSFSCSPSANQRLKLTAVMLGTRLF